MFEHLNTPEEVFSFKLGSALSMERDTLDMLGDLEAGTSRPELKTLFREHAVETRQQIANIERSFELLGEPVDDSPSPTTKGLAKEGKATIKKTDASIVDAVILAGALETEHYEIAVYETLVINADARGAGEVAALLRANLQQEEAARDKVKQAMLRISQQGIAISGRAAE
jgi:ferritin-like metal-binding protein YciE